MIPFAVLQDQREGEFLIEQITVATTPGLTLTEPRPIDRDKVRMLAAGVGNVPNSVDLLEN
jgi:CHAT domain-containing protein